MNAQEIFDTIARHLLTQKRRAVDDNTYFCRYRTSEGLRCAAGALIPDEVYSPALEHSSFQELAAIASADDPVEAWSVEFCKGFPEEFVKFVKWFNAQKLKPFSPLIQHLQLIHDRWAPEKWADELHTAAKNYGLDSKVLEEFV